VDTDKLYRLLKQQEVVSLRFLGLISHLGTWAHQAELFL